MRLVIYGDFNCPFSALASERAARAQAAGLASVEWRAVQHLPALPPEGEPVGDQLMGDLAEELDRIAGLLLDGESFPARVPEVRPSTQPATTAFAASPDDRRQALRQRLFRAYWYHGRDISDPAVLVELGARASADSPEAVAQWQKEWDELDRPLTPMMERGDGSISRGLQVLNDLAELLTNDEPQS